jgi:hypothetical protein
MAKTLCKLKKKEIHKDLDKLIELIDKPKFICRDCLRQANEKELLCEALKIN